MKEITLNKYSSDLLKIYFCLTVVIVHISTVIFKFNIFHNYGVPGFLFISGYGCYIALSKYSYSIFLKKRLSFIIYPYYVCILFYLIAHFYFGFQGGLTTHANTYTINYLNELKGLISHLLFIHNWHSSTMWKVASNLWFMAAIVQLYFFSSLLKKILDKAPFIFIMLIVLYLLISIKLNKWDISIFAIANIICFIPFMLGMLISKYSSPIFFYTTKILKNKINFYLYSIISLFSMYLSTIRMHEQILSTFLIIFTLPFMIILLNFIFSKFINPHTASKLTPFCFFIYLYNYAFLVFYDLITTNYKILNFIIYFIVIIITSLFFYKLDKISRNIFKTKQL